jgi:hypothetical protein
MFYREILAVCSNKQYGGQIPEDFNVKIFIT